MGDILTLSGQSFEKCSRTGSKDDRDNASLGPSLYYRLSGAKAHHT